MPFNLLQDPWIPLEGPRGHQEVGLLEAFDLAKDHRLAAEAYVLTPLLRFLLLVAHQAVGRVRGVDDLAALTPETLASLVRERLAPYQERFDLFSPDFFLSPQGGLPGTATEKPLAYLRPDWPSGSSALLRIPKRARGSLPPGEVARNLLVFLAYHPGGLFGAKEAKSLEGGLLARHLAFFALGKTLHQTLLLNLVDGEAPPPLWEAPVRAGEVEGYRARKSPKALDRHLFPSYLFVLQEERGQVAGLTVVPGFRHAPGEPDPMMAHGSDGEPLRTTERAFRRATGAERRSWRGSSGRPCPTWPRPSPPRGWRSSWGKIPSWRTTPSFRA